MHNFHSVCAMIILLINKTLIFIIVICNKMLQGGLEKYQKKLDQLLVRLQSSSAPSISVLATPPMLWKKADGCMQILSKQG